MNGPRDLYLTFRFFHIATSLTRSDDLFFYMFCAKQPALNLFTILIPISVYKLN